MKFNNNPYYNPEKCGLEIFDEIDTAGDYEYDKFVVWRKLDDGTLWWDTDSGCSCPAPFGPSDNGHELKEITTQTFYNFELELKNHPRISKKEYYDLYYMVKKYLKNQN